jgi:hypothetical protein
MLDAMKFKYNVYTCVFDVYGLQLKVMGCFSYLFYMYSSKD